MRCRDRRIDIESERATQRDVRRVHVNIDRELGSDAIEADHNFSWYCVRARASLNRCVDDATSERDSGSLETGDAHGAIELRLHDHGWERDLLSEHVQ